MAYDPSIISKIGQMGARPMDAMQDAYTLKNVIDTSQLNQMKLNEERQAQSDAQTLRSIAGKYDMSNPEDQSKFFAEAVKINPSMGMKLQREFTELQSGQAQNQEAQYRLWDEQHGIVTNAMLPIYQLGVELKAGGADTPTINSRLLGLITNATNTLKQQNLSNGAKLLTPEMQQQAVALTQSPDILATLEGFMQTSKQSREALDKLRERTTQSRREAAQESETTTIRGSDGKSHRVIVNKITGEVKDLGIAESPERPLSVNVNAPSPSDVSENAKAIAAYKRAPPSGRSPGSQRIMAEVYKINPDYDETFYGEKQKAVKDFGSGKQGDLVRSLNVSVNHLATLDDITKDLSNKDVKAINRFYNVLAAEFGKTNITDFNLAKQVVADEVVKAVLGSGAGTGADRAHFQEQFNAANSPEQLADVIKTAKKLMGGQLVGLRAQYEEATGLSDFNKKLSKHTVKALEGLEPDSTEPSPVAPGPAVTPPPSDVRPGATGAGPVKKWKVVGGKLVEEK